MIIRNLARNLAYFKNKEFANCAVIGIGSLSVMLSQRKKSHLEFFLQRFRAAGPKKNPF
jgi:hypothetical protein